jgi:hypothetical protein
MKRFIFSLILIATLPLFAAQGGFRPPFLIKPTPVEEATAATAHIWVDGSGTCVDNASPIEYDSATACATIDAGWTAADAGDTVRVKAGAYVELAAAAVNGSAGSPITLVAESGVTTCGLVITNNSYLRFIGFTFDPDASGCAGQQRNINLSGTNDHLEFWNNTLQNGHDGFGAASTVRVNNSLLIGNVLKDMVSNEAGIVAVYTAGDHNLYAYNECNHPDPDCFYTNGTYNRWLNNYIHNVTEVGGHSDFFQFGSHDLGVQYNTLEANIQIGVGSGDEHTLVWQDYQSCDTSCSEVTENVLRRNVTHDIGSGTWGIAVATNHDMTYSRIYHNHEVTTQRSGNDSGYAGAFIYTGTNHTSIRNNLAYEDWAPTIDDANTRYVYYAEDAVLDMDYNLAYDADASSPTWASFWTNQANEQTQVNPQFVDFANDDFHLQVSSGAIGVAGRLTTTSGSGTGTTFNVAANTGGFFRGDDTNIDHYSGALVKGDTITVGTDVVEVASISGDAITVTSSFTWADGENVFYGDDTTPDMGAYPYKAGGYALSATYSCNGSTCTITPNDAGLVRFVVCYENGIPYAVDHTSAYACTDPSGTFQARVYSMFASTTLWVVATP